MLVEVYHAKKPNFGLATPERPNPIWPDGFEHVADVTIHNPAWSNADCLECAFTLTNHVSSFWHTNPHSPVRCLVENPRSTSVGDMAVINGTRYLCAPVGWMEIAPDGS